MRVPAQTCSGRVGSFRLRVVVSKLISSLSTTCSLSNTLLKLRAPSLGQAAFRVLTPLCVGLINPMLTMFTVCISDCVGVDNS